MLPLAILQGKTASVPETAKLMCRLGLTAGRIPGPISRQYAATDQCRSNSVPQSPPVGSLEIVRWRRGGATLDTLDRNRCLVPEHGSRTQGRRNGDRGLPVSWEWTKGSGPWEGPASPRFGSRHIFEPRCSGHSQYYLATGRPQRG